MKPFIRTKTINGRKYRYEITAFYDKATGKTRQTSRYLGKAGGSRDAGNIPEKRAASRILACGEYLPFLAAMQDISLEKTLSQIIPPEYRAGVLALAISLATQPCPLPILRAWYSRSVISLACPGADLRPRSIRRLLEDISGYGILEAFSEEMAGNTPGGIFPQAGFFVSVSAEESSPFLNEYSPRGSAPVTDHYLVTCSPDTGIVTGCRKIPDHFLTRMQVFRREKGAAGNEIPVIFPEGIFGSGHLFHLAGSRIPFVLPVPPFRVLGRENARAIQQSVRCTVNFRTFSAEPVYVRSSPVTIGGMHIPGFLILSPNAERLVKSRLYRNMYRLNENLRTRHVPFPLDDNEAVLELTGDLAPLVQKPVPGPGTNDSFDREAVEAATIDAGMLLVLHRGGLRREECIALLFRRREFNTILSERCSMLRNMLAPIITEEMDEGLIFIALLATMLRWRLEKRLLLVKGWAGASLDGLPILLGTITLAVGPGRKREAGGMVHGQRSILTALDCMPERVIPGCRIANTGEHRQKPDDAALHSSDPGIS